VHVSIGEDSLAEQLVLAVRNEEEVTLLLGSGVTAQAVPRVDRILALAERYAAGRGDDGDLARALAQARTELNAEALPFDVYCAYRRVFVDWVSGDGFDVVAQQAVLEAYRPSDWSVSLLATHGIWQRVELPLGESVENDLGSWDLPPGVQAIGQLLARRAEDFGNRILTTNFDPLVEVSIRCGGVRATSVPINSDGSVGVLAVDAAVRVFHLHGFWRPTLEENGARLLHEPSNRMRAQPEMVQAISDRITGDVVCVVGCGGWDAIVTAALREVMRSRPVRVLWALHQSEDRVARDESDRLRRTIGASLACYTGIDSDSLFVRLARGLDVPPMERVADPRHSVRHIGWEQELITQPDTAPPNKARWLLRHLERRFGWGLGGPTSVDEPELLFWPVRLRQRASLIHAVQAIAAGALAARGLRMVVCLDDFGVNRREAASARFESDLRRWVGRTGPADAVEFVSLEDFIDGYEHGVASTATAALLRPTHPWAVARAFYGEHNPLLYSVLAALKVVPNVSLRDLDSHAPAIVQALLSKDANRLLTPGTIWSFLNHLLQTESTMKVVTLGGQDERMFWEQWRAVFQFEVGQLYNPYIKSLSNQSGMVRWSSIGELREHLGRAHRMPGWNEEGGYIPWLFQNALLLPAYLGQEPLPEIDNYQLDSWAAFAAALETGAPALDLLAMRASDLYLGKRDAGHD